jgi:hypothetical protein
MEAVPLGPVVLETLALPSAPPPFSLPSLSAGTDCHCSLPGQFNRQYQFTVGV